MNTPFFTVFTPVYNRRALLHRVWESLCAQTDRDFEWIVVDDGSTDGVGELLAEYQAQADFPMTVLKQANQGKHFAWNRAVDLAKGTLFVPADSDDEFLPGTLARFRAHWLAIPETRRGRYSGVNVLCRDQNGETVGNFYPQDVMTSDNLELFYKYKVYGEKWGCLRTDLLRLRKFPEIKGRGCFPLTWLFYWLAQDYRVICVNEVLRVYYRDSSNCITQSERGRKALQSSEVRYLALGWHLDANVRYVLKYESILRVVRSYVGLWRVGLGAGHKVRSLIVERTSILSKILMAITMPMGIVFYHFSRSNGLSAK